MGDTTLVSIVAIIVAGIGGPAITSLATTAVSDVSSDTNALYATPRKCAGCSMKPAQR